MDMASPVREQIYGAIRAFTSATVAESEDATKAIILIVSNALPEVTIPPHSTPDVEDFSRDFEEHDCGEDTCVCRDA